VVDGAIGGDNEVFFHYLAYWFWVFVLVHVLSFFVTKLVLFVEFLIGTHSTSVPGTSL